MGKKLNVDAIANELSGGSAFFPSYKKLDSLAPAPVEESVQPPESANASPKVEKLQDTSSTKAPPSPQPVKTTNAQLAKTEKFDKYSTYLRPGYKKELKIIALEKDCKDYEVLDEAITLYLKSLQNK